MCSLNLFKGALENDMFLFHFVLERRKFKQPSKNNAEQLRQRQNKQQTPQLRR